MNYRAQNRPEKFRGFRETCAKTPVMVALCSQVNIPSSPAMNGDIPVLPKISHIWRIPANTNAAYS